MRPSEFLNTTFGYPYAALAILCFIASCILVLLAFIRARRVTGRLCVAAIVLVANLALGGWLLLSGPGQTISVSEVVIQNGMSQQIPLVSCPFFQTELIEIPEGESRQVPVMPKAEGELKIVVRLPDGRTLTQEAVIMEAWAETFRFQVSDGGIAFQKE